MTICPDILAQVDVARVRFTLDFLTPCTLQPADFLGLGRTLRMCGRQLFETADAVTKSQYEAFFQPFVSVDPIARQKHQKPAPPYVMSMPIQGSLPVDAGDQLPCEVLFLGTGVPLIHVFLRSLAHLGHLGLSAGEGRFEVADVSALGLNQPEVTVWRQGEPMMALPCTVEPLSWHLCPDGPVEALTLRFMTPTRLLVAGRPLRKPRFDQLFPFMLRRVTSMLHAHAGVDVCPDAVAFFALARQLTLLESDLVWQDWRALKGPQGMQVGGFLGSMRLSGPELDDLYWIVAAASMFGLGKAAATGAGRFEIAR